MEGLSAEEPMGSGGPAGTQQRPRKWSWGGGRAEALRKTKCYKAVDSVSNSQSS